MINDTKKMLAFSGCWSPLWLQTKLTRNAGELTPPILGAGRPQPTIDETEWINYPSSFINLARINLKRIFSTDSPGFPRGIKFLLLTMTYCLLMNSSTASLISLSPFPYLYFLETTFPWIRAKITILLQITGQDL